MKLFKVLVSAIALLATLILPAQANNPNCTEVDGDYIVSFPRGIAIANEMRAVPGRPIQAKFTYDTVLNGFAATLTAEQACAFQRRPGAVVERDLDVQTQATSQSLLGQGLWGLDRIDQASNSLDNLFNIDSKGQGVYAFVIDTGIYSAHQEFSGRVITGFSAIKDRYGTQDCNGHGTHVAGTIGGSNYGVAKSVTLVPVRVLNCTGSGKNSGVIAGVDWVAKSALRPAVANMSLGGGANSTLDSAVRNLINKGVTVVVAAGNDNIDASRTSPARVQEAITVAASDLNDAKAGFSNWGAIIDVHAPGVGIKSSWIGGVSASRNLQGTSMASPHVAGIVARYLQLNPSATTLNISSAVISAANPKSGTIRVACLTGTNECKS